jgi:hypothetical protein
VALLPSTIHIGSCTTGWKKWKPSETPSSCSPHSKKTKTAPIFLYPSAAYLWSLILGLVSQEKLGIIMEASWKSILPFLWFTFQKGKKTVFCYWISRPKPNLSSRYIQYTRDHSMLDTCRELPRNLIDHIMRVKVFLQRRVLRNTTSKIRHSNACHNWTGQHALITDISS